MFKKGKGTVWKVILILSIVLNVLLGYWYGKNAIYMIGFQNGQVACKQQVNSMLEQGQILMKNPTPVVEEVEEEPNV